MGRQESGKKAGPWTLRRLTVAETHWNRTCWGLQVRREWWPIQSFYVGASVDVIQIENSSKLKKIVEFSKKWRVEYRQRSNYQISSRLTSTLLNLSSSSDESPPSEDAVRLLGDRDNLPRRLSGVRAPSMESPAERDEARINRDEVPYTGIIIQNKSCPYISVTPDPDTKSNVTSQYSWESYWGVGTQPG
jgi:hypothetical protein